jgi:hypothetical protein
LRPLIIIDPETGTSVEERMEALPDHAAGHQQDGASGAAPITDPRGEVQAHFKTLTGEAKEHGPWSRFLMRICLQLFLLASAFGFAKLVFELEGWPGFALGGAAVLTIVSALVLMGKRARSHQRWLQCRAEAEICRSFLATWDIRRHAKFGEQPSLAIHGFAKLFSTLRLMRQLDRSPLAGIDEARSAYCKGRVENQMDYFGREADRAKTSLAQRKRVMKVCSILAVICELAVLVMALRSHGPGRLNHWLEFLALTLPLMTTALGLTLISQEAERRSMRYAEMKQTMQRLNRQLLASNTWDALARVATEVEEELFQELVEWQSFIRFTRDLAHHG